LLYLPQLLLQLVLSSASLFSMLLLLPAIAMKAKTEGNSNRSDAEDSFNILSSWTPYLFDNPGDHICL
jgi:hypothetical protein